MQKAYQLSFNTELDNLSETCSYMTLRQISSLLLCLCITKMRSISIKRQNQTRSRQKAKWTLYEEKHFKKVIADITSLLNDLIELFPAARALQKNLCKAELAEMSAKEDFPMLVSVIRSQDKLLEEAIVETMNQKTPTPYITFSGSYNSESQLTSNT